MDNAKPRLIVPVENQVRELDAKLLFACVAAERGFAVTLGSRTYVNFAMPFLPRGVFLAKSLRAISGRMFRVVHGLGHDIVAWDEESLVRFSSPEYYDFRYSEETFGHVDRLFAWGEDDAELFRNYRGYTGVPIHVTGNPRLDMLRPELRGFFDAETRELRDRHGDFILLNTNFPFVNPFVPALHLLRASASGQQTVGRTGLGMSLEFARGYAAHIQTICEHFKQLLPQLSAWFPDHKIVVRPHPSEDHETWRRVAGSLPNIEVLHEGNVVPWLLASRALLHNGCTTAVEAALLDKPALTYQPVTSDCYDYPLPNALSHRASTPEQVRDGLRAILDGRLGPCSAELKAQVLAHHVAGASGPLAADRVMDVLEAAGYRDTVRPRPAAASYAGAWLHANGRTAVKLFNRLRPKHRNGRAYHEHRYPEVSSADIEQRLTRFRELLGRFDGVTVARRSRFIFEVSAATVPVAATGGRGSPRPTGSNGAAALGADSAP